MVSVGARIGIFSLSDSKAHALVHCIYLSLETWRLVDPNVVQILGYLEKQQLGIEYLHYFLCSYLGTCIKPV